MQKRTFVESCQSQMQWASVVSPTAATINVYKSFWRVLRSQALETPVEPDLALHQSLPDLLQDLLRNPVEPDLALHQSLPDLHRNLLRNPVGTFSGTLLNLTWLCTKASPTFSGTFSALAFPPRLPGTFSGTVSGTLLTPVEPDLALHQKPPRPSQEPSPEPSSKPCWTWPGSAPKTPRPSPEPSLKPRWTWPGSAPKPPRPSPEPSREPCWTWPGSAPKPPRPSPEPSEPSPKLRWTWPGACTNADRSYSGLKTPLAYAVGEKTQTQEGGDADADEEKEDEEDDGIWRWRWPQASLNAVMLFLSTPKGGSACWPFRLIMILVAATASPLQLLAFCLFGIWQHSNFSERFSVYCLFASGHIFSWRFDCEIESVWLQIWTSLVWFFWCRFLARRLDWKFPSGCSCSDGRRWNWLSEQISHKFVWKEMGHQTQSMQKQRLLCRQIQLPSHQRSTKLFSFRLCTPLSNTWATPAVWRGKRDSFLVAFLWQTRKQASKQTNKQQTNKHVQEEIKQLRPVYTFYTNECQWICFHKMKCRVNGLLFRVAVVVTVWAVTAVAASLYRIT